MKVKHFILFLAMLSVLASCDLSGGGDVVSSNGYQHGVFVVNEGPFNGSGSITFHNTTSGETTPDVFALENNGAVLGQFVQSLTFYNGKGYIVVNGANKVVIVDEATFEQVGVIEGLALPRFFLPINDNYAYVSQWGADGLSGSVAKVDLNTKLIVTTIATGHGPEKMIRLNNTEFAVANSGGYGLDSTISIINTELDKETNRITVAGKNPAEFIKPAFGKPLVLCNGYFSDTTSTGWIGDYNPTTAFSADLPRYPADMKLSPDATRVYFIAGGYLYYYDESGLHKSFKQAAYGFGVHPTRGDLIFADAKDFNSNGLVTVYDSGGQVLGSFEAGVSPGEIIVKQ